MAIIALMIIMTIMVIMVIMAIMANKERNDVYHALAPCGNPLLDYPGRVQSTNSSVSFYSDVWGKRSYRGPNMVKDTLSFLITT